MLEEEFENQVAAGLRGQAATLGAHWRSRAEAITASGPSPMPSCDPEAVILALADTLIGDPHGTVQLAREGWRIGSASREAGVPLHYLVRDLQLLDAIVLHATEQLAFAPELSRHGLQQSFRVARGLQRASALLVRAAVKGFSHADQQGQRRHLSMLRHDLRNPLGVIRNAIAFLEDDAIPEHLRDPQRFRVIIARNARQAEALVTERLSETSLLAGEMAMRDVPIREVALAVRRQLRGEARAAGVEIVVAEHLPVVSADPTMVELALLASVAGALESGAGARLAIQPDTARERSVRIRLATDRAEHHEVPGLELAREVARWAGGELSLSDPLVLELPASAIQAGGDLTGAGER